MNHNNSGSVSNGKKSVLPTPDRQESGRQYFYSYGSTSNKSTVELEGRKRNGTTPRESGSPYQATSETDSLVGESLVLTDDEGVFPHNLKSDYQQRFISKSNGNGTFQSPPDYQQNFSGGCCDCNFLSSLRKRFHRQHRAFQFLWVVGLMALLFLLFLMLFPNSPISTKVVEVATNSSTESQQSPRQLRMPFPMIDRNDYNDPVSNFLDTSLIHSSLLNSDRDTNNSTGNKTFRFPFPTGSFWTNLVLPPTADKGLSYPVAVYPYAYKWSNNALQASYPAQHRSEDAKAIHDYFFPDLSFETSQNVAARKITGFDPLSVTLRYYTAGSKSGFWESYLVQGSPYITIKYNAASPVIKAFTTFTNLICPREEQNSLMRRQLKFGVCYSNNNTTEQRDKQLTTLHGVQFILETQEGTRWIGFASELIALKFDTKTRTTIVASAEDGSPYTGIMRFAILPPTPQEQHGTDQVTTQATTALDQIENSKGMQRLIYHAGVYPVSGKVSWTFRSAGSESSSSPTLSVTKKIIDSITLSASSSTSDQRIGSIEFKFQTNSFTQTSTTPNLLLMLALPHHAQSLPSNILLGNDQFDLIYKCIKGPMRPVVGSSWGYDEALPKLGFDGDSGSSTTKNYLEPSVKRTILKNLKVDVDLALPTPTENIYGFAKQAARIAQIAHIANMLMDGSTVPQKQSTEASELDIQIAEVLKKAKDALHNALNILLTGKVSDSLVYDANLGGIVTSDGLRDTHADFGNGRYNDHHFHYGYILFASAHMGKLDPTFVKTHGIYVDALYLDIANDSNFDSIESSSGVFLPGSRHKIWFDGHSFASGMFPFGNGKSQESSSEAVNCYYGAYLWSLVRNDCADDPSSDVSAQTDFARLLLATELRGAKTYWHMMPPRPKLKNETGAVTIYSPEFSKNYMVGNMGMLDALCTTWFGTESLYVHMINFIPVTSITGELFGAEYVSQEYTNVIEPLQEVEMAWQGYVVSDHAIVDPNAAWVAAQNLFSPTLDTALSKSQVLYWISTRSNFNSSAVDDGNSSRDSTLSSDTSEDGNAFCDHSPVCAQTGLVGNCCPTDSGLMLACCKA